MTTIGFDNIVLDTLNHRGAKYSDLKVAGELKFALRIRNLTTNDITFLSP